LDNTRILEENMTTVSLASNANSASSGHFNVEVCYAQFPVKKNRVSLKEYQVVEIFKLMISKNGLKLSATKVAHAYGISEKTVRDIWTGRTWKQTTWHLDNSRPLVLKKRGRPQGSKDRQPRKQSAVLNRIMVASVESEIALERKNHGRTHGSLQITTMDSSRLISVLSRSNSTIDDVLFDWDFMVFAECLSRNPFDEDWAPDSDWSGIGCRHPPSCSVVDGANPKNLPLLIICFDISSWTIMRQRRAEVQEAFSS
jgi:hypothetical protein